MVESTEESVQRRTGLRRSRLKPRQLLGERSRTVLAAVPRVMLLLVIVWAFTGPIDRTPFIAGAAGLAPSAVQPERSVRAGQMFPETGFAVADGPIGNYFAARGGARTFGPPISNAFPLLGSTVQLFRNHMLKVEADGSVSTVDLFGMNAIPFRNVGGVIVPEIDPYLLATAPVPGSPDYATKGLAFIRETAPDQFEGLPVGFYQAFLGTVRAEDAMPGGGELALLPLFSKEIWGVPVSRPVRDALNPDSIIQRWERGVMVWSRSTGSVTALPLGDAFKSLLTGEALGPEQTAQSNSSQFLLQYAPNSPGGVARPSDLPSTVLAGAFGDQPTGVAAAQLSDPTSTPTPLAPGATLPPPPPPPAGVAGGELPPAPGALPPAPGALPPAPGALPPAPGAPAAGAPTPPVGGTPGTGAVPPPGAASASADRCYGDEMITFSPADPRVNNELLIAVSSSRPHPYGRLAGTEKTTFVRERPGQAGTVWEWTIALTWPGKHEYTFYVDSTIPCKKMEVTVRQPLTTRTPTPTKTATPWGWDNGNNNNSNNNNSNNSNDNNSNDILDCAFLGSQAQAQSQLRADPRDPHRLDTENNQQRDGIACTSYPYPAGQPTDYNVVPPT